MSYHRILAAVDDSPAGLEAARTAMALAGGPDAVVRVVSVVRDHDLQAAIGGEPTSTHHQLAAATQSVLAWAGELAAAHKVACETVERSGEPFRKILDEADDWGADVIVIGRSDRRGPSSAYLGSETAHVLEFAVVPVLVVPSRPR